MRLNHDKKAALALAALVLAFLLNWWIGPDPSDARAIERPTAALCFPLALWDAPRGQRPCHAVTRVFEDGSAWLQLGTARRAIYRCEVPSPFEEGRTFSIKCRRVGR